MIRSGNKKAIAHQTPDTYFIPRFHWCNSLTKKFNCFKDRKYPRPLQIHSCRHTYRHAHTHKSREGRRHQPECSGRGSSAEDGFGQQKGGTDSSWLLWALFLPLLRQPLQGPRCSLLGWGKLLGEDKQEERRNYRKRGVCFSKRTKECIGLVPKSTESYWLYPT